MPQPYVPIRQPLTWTSAATTDALGALDGGYALTTDYSSLYLYDCRTATPVLVATTSLGSHTVQAAPINASGESNDEGVFAMVTKTTGPTTFYLTYVTHSGSTLTVTHYALHDTWSVRDLFVAGDGSGVIVLRDKPVGPPTTVDFDWYDMAGSLQATWSSSITIATNIVAYHPRASRVVVMTPTAGTTPITLHDASGTSLDTDSCAYDYGTDDIEWYATGRDTVTYVRSDNSGIDIRWRTLSTAGDVLTWLNSEQTLNTNWPTNALGAWGTWQGQLAGASYGAGSPSLYWINPATGSVTQSGHVGASRFELCCPSWYSTLTSGTGGLRFYSGPASNPGLRLRQSPRSNPTRIGQNPTLRARQKFV